MVDYNDVLTRFDSYFKRNLDKIIGNKKAHIDKDDILQEVRIRMYELLRDKYDPEIGDVNVFVVSHTYLCIKYVLLRILKSLYYTGKSPGEGYNNRTVFNKINHGLDNVEVYRDEYKYINSQLDAEIYLREAQKLLCPELWAIFILISVYGYNQTETAKLLGDTQTGISSKVKEIRIRLKSLNEEFSL